MVLMVNMMLYLVSHGKRKSTNIIIISAVAVIIIIMEKAMNELFHPSISQLIKTVMVWRKSIYILNTLQNSIQL